MAPDLVETHAKGRVESARLVVQLPTQALGHRQDLLAHRRRWQDMVDRMRAAASVMRRRWWLDLTRDVFANGRKFRTANLKDYCTRKRPTIEVDFSLLGERTMEMLHRVARERGCPDMLVIYNRP